MAILLGFVILSLSCSWDNNDDGPKSMEDLEVDPYFPFNTDRQVSIDISGPLNTDCEFYLEYNGEFDPENPDTTLLEELIIETETDSIDGTFTCEFPIPTYKNNIYLKYFDEIKELTIHNLDGQTGEIIDSFSVPEKWKGKNFESKCFAIWYYYPSRNSFGTLMFEDLWPSKGDYDMNDLVVDYKMIEKYYRRPYFHVPGIGWFYRIYAIEATFRLRAVGAGYTLAFAMQLPNLCSISGEVTSDLPQGITIETDNNTLILVGDAHDAFDSSLSGSWINTNESDPYYPIVEFTVNIPIEYVPASDPAWTQWDNDRLNPIYNPPYNPFIYPEGNRDQEIHLSNYPPTDSMNYALFGTGDDASDPQNEIYYKTSNGLPWAVHITKSTVYPIETKQITSAFLYFGEWAESGGSSHDDWYEDNSGYRDNSNIYSAP